VPIVVWEIIGVVGFAAVIWLAVRYLRPALLRRSHNESADVDEERDSVFTWSHLIEQLRVTVLRALGQLRRLWRRRGETAHEPAPPVEAGGNRLAPFEDIRSAYRQVLVVARQQESPRGAAETAQEFERRLSRDFATHPEADASASLHVLTSLYQRVRYGDDRLREHDLQSGHAAADVVIARLQSPGSTEPS
jgi:hypothetical protein